MPTTNQNDNVIIAFAKRLRNREVMPFDEFIDFALYDEEIGYYSSLKKRVGRSENTDFYTSSSFGSLWGELIVDACKTILQKETLAHFTFVEIAAEPGQSILEGVRHPFEKSQVIRLGEDIEIPSPAIVYSNEWLDAQPFKRFRFCTESGIWQERGVSLEKNSFQETYLIDNFHNHLKQLFFLVIFP